MNDLGSERDAPLRPDTTAEQLAELAATRPDLWPAILAHPNAYPDLRQWVTDRLAEHAAPAPVDAAHLALPATGLQPLDSAVHGTAIPGEPMGSHDVTDGGAPIVVEGVASNPAPPTPKRRTRLLVTLSAVLVALLGLGGTATVLGLNGTLAGWFGGQANTPAATALDFSAGLERQWVSDANDYVTPKIGEQGQDFSYLRWGYSRGAIAYDEADMPVASSTAVLFNARGEDSKLIMREVASGDTLLAYDLGGQRAACAVDRFVAEQPFYCVTVSLERPASTLLKIDPRGAVSEERFDLALQRVTVGPDRVVLTGEQGEQRAAVAIDRGGRELWKRTDLANGSFAGVDMSADRTLVRGMTGWTLLGADGVTLASAKVVGVYDGGDGSCDARLSEGGHLFVTGGDSCVKAEADVTWWGFGKNLEGVSLFSAGGQHYVVRSGNGSVELRRFPEGTDTRLETVIALDLQARLAGVLEGDEPALVLVGDGVAQTLALADGRTIASWKFGGSVGDASALLLDAAGTVLIGETAYDARTGTPLWQLTEGLELRSAWMSDAGLIVLGGGCATCSSAGGRTSLSTLTLYTPLNSGGVAISTEASKAGDRGDRQSESDVPAFIPACPGTTVRLAWAEISDGWIVVCGVNSSTPTYLAVKTGRQGTVLSSVGASQPTGSDAQQAVAWNAGEQRFTAKMSDGTRVTLDYRLGTATIVDPQTNTTKSQSLMIRYVFVPMGSAVRTSVEGAGKAGAFGVETPKETAADQVRYLQQVIERAYEGRALVKEALPKLAGCTAAKGGYSDTITQMETVRDNRAALLEAIESMPVDKIPEGTLLLDHLRQAIQASYEANIEYVAWAQAANASGCAQLSASGQAAAVASDPPKERFAELWNRTIAPQFGVRTFDPWYI